MRQRGEQQQHLQGVNKNAVALAQEWRRLGRAATIVAVLTSPMLFVVLYQYLDWSLALSIFGTFVGVAAFRGAVDVLGHKLVPSPSIYRATKDLKDQDVLSRRRLWFWRRMFRFIFRLVFIGLLVSSVVALFKGVSISEAFSLIIEAIPGIITAAPGLLLTFTLLFLINFGILFGPLMFLGAQQIKGYEPGDADWGVKLADVRGQAEAKEEIRRVVELWQSGEEFEKAGGKRERGVLFLGSPGTGKTMLSKAIATSFNAPFVTIPGSGFAQTFIGMDAVLVRFLAWKAKRLAAKWGGQCIVFIDEIDAVGLRRAQLGRSATSFETGGTVHDWCFYGPTGALTPGGDIVIESAAWRDRLFAERANPPGAHYPAFVNRMSNFVNGFMMPGMGGGGGSLALAQLLVVMDGIQDPPAMKKFFTNKTNTWLDAAYIIPRKIGPIKLRRKPPRPRKEEIYFIGACNVPIEALDPALTRPGRMGRHIYFRTPSWEDRRDIFDLYLGNVDHEEELDSPKKRSELARITNGYSPAMIDQVCSLALTYAHTDGRAVFNWTDIVEAMTTVETGVAIAQPYASHEERSIAIHEAGHAVCSHLYSENVLSTRLSIRKRGNSGGHHQAMYLEDRFVEWRSEEVAFLIHTLGAMAAETVFYGQNTTGVGGDIQSATRLAARMVGFHAMAPTPIDLSDRIKDEEERELEQKRVTQRFETLGYQLMHRSGGGMMDSDPMAGVFSDPEKRKLAAGLLGQAFIVAYRTIQKNRVGTEHVANILVEKRELYGDEVVELLDSAELVKPEIDVLDEATWPVI